MLSDLPRFKDSVFFGQNMIHQSKQGMLRIGDLVHVLDKKPTPFEFAPGFVDGQKQGSQEEKDRIEEYGF